LPPGPCGPTIRIQWRNEIPGWIQYHCSSNQEVFNTILQAFRVAEQINIPVMVNLMALLFLIV